MPPVICTPLSCCCRTPRSCRGLMPKGSLGLEGPPPLLAPKGLEVGMRPGFRCASRPCIIGSFRYGSARGSAFTAAGCEEGAAGEPPPPKATRGLLKGVWDIEAPSAGDVPLPLPLPPLPLPPPPPPPPPPLPSCLALFRNGPDGPGFWGMLIMGPLPWPPMNPPIYPPLLSLYVTPGP